MSEQKPQRLPVDQVLRILEAQLQILKTMALPPYFVVPASRGDEERP